jgi:putative transposase
MQQFQIGKGLIISTNGSQYEYTDRAVGEFYFQAIDNGKRIIIEEQDFWPGVQRGSISVLYSTCTQEIIQTHTSDQTPQRFISEISPKYFNDLKRRLHYVQGLNKEGVTRGRRKKIARTIPKLAKAIKDDMPPAASTVQTWMLQHGTSLDPNVALVNANAFRKRGERIDDESEQFLQDQIQKHYAKLERPSISGAYTYYKDDLLYENARGVAQRAAPLYLVSEKTFYNRIKKLPQKELLISRFGYEIARKMTKISQGNLPSDYPLDVVEIDHTPMNLYVVDDASFLPLGRPYLTAIKDRHSGILLGFYISFHASGLKPIFAAIKHSLYSHQKAYEIWPDIENPWPAFGLGNMYCSDRGPDFQSMQYQSAIKDLGADYELCEVRTPWVKGSIERFFHTLESTFFETMPGKTFNSLQNRKDYNPQKYAVIRFSTLVYLIHKWAADFHNVTSHSRKMASPLELWNEGIELAPPRHPVSPQGLDVILGHRLSGTIQNEGIQYLGLHYANKGLQALADEIGKGKSVEFILSPENMGNIHLKDPRTGEYMRVNCTRPDYAEGLSLFQHRYLRHEAKISNVSMRSVDEHLSFRKVLALEIQGDIDAKNNYASKQYARIAEINSNATLNSKARTTTNVFGNLKEDTVPVLILPESDKEIVVPFTDIPFYDLS